MSAVHTVIPIIVCLGCFESDRVVVITKSQKSPLCNHIHDKFFTICQTEVVLILI